MVSNRELSITFTSNGKTRICTTWPSFLLTFRLLFINSTPKLIVVLYNFLSLRIVLSCFYLLIFCFEKFSSWIWRLPYTWSSLLQPVQTSLIIQRLNKKKHLRERTTSMVSQSLLSKKKKEIRATKIVWIATFKGILILRKVLQLRWCQRTVCHWNL